MTTSSSSPSLPSSGPPPLTTERQRTLLAALCVAGFLASLWALFQWGELLVARAGGTPFCAVGAGFDCSAVWDSGFARVVHNVTRVPVAGWGLMWGVLAFLLPLVALVRPGALGEGGISAALRLTALVGAASVVGLAGASAAAGAICLGCIGTYVLVAIWTALAFVATREHGFTRASSGVVWSAAITLGAWAVLLVPGMRTPPAMSAMGKEALAKAAAEAQLQGGAGSSGTSQPLGPTAQGPFAGPPLADPAKEAALAQLLAQMPPEALQTMSDLLADYEKMPRTAAVPPARAVKGAADAPVVIVDWTDPLCPHCAELHEVLDEIVKIAPGAVRVESHHFPLDGLCNASVERKNEMGPVRCAATRAMACLESEPEKLHLAQKLIFENQAGLSEEKLASILKPIANLKDLQACMSSPETQAKLDIDIRAGMANNLEGTPLVLLNGKEAKPFGPVLYALTLTGGVTRTRAFAGLPPPKPLPAHNHPH